MAETSTKRRQSSIPGQMSMDIDLSGNFHGYKESSRDVDVARKYWRKFDKFLDLSGVYARYHNFLIQVESDPTWKEIKLMKDSVEKEKITSDKIRHLSLMKGVYNSRDVDTLKKKTERRKFEYRNGYDSLIMAAREAGVDPKIRDSYVETLLDAFVLSDTCTKGGARREFYRRKFVRPALKKLEKDEYFAPVDIRDIEKAFEKDTGFLASYYRKKENSKKKLKKSG
ncbi:hypothetical protein IJI76_00030 [Candidatus Saccharibacteria bacterium]|nr:hypothetical protein [Candidatus Saccharibacteria bacterium]